MCAALASLQAALTEARKKADWPHNTNYMTAPWPCVGGVMALDARAKFKKVDFISKHPSDPHLDRRNVRPWCACHPAALRLRAPTIRSSARSSAHNHSQSYRTIFGSCGYRC
jgi:hypothetical protein